MTHGKIKKSTEIIENKYKIIPFWSWNTKLDKTQLLRQIDWMYENGIGGFFMHARSGLQTEYLSEEWFDCINACTKRARELGMEPYVYDEHGWPSGFCGGKLLEDEENLNTYLVFKKGRFDKNADVSYCIREGEIVRQMHGEHNINLYIMTSDSTVDILNPEIVDKFIANTHEKYRATDHYGICGFFTDEPQYYRGQLPFSRMLIPYFKEKYGESVFDKLPLLFMKEKGYREFRYRYWKAMQELMLKNYAERLYRWCSEHSYCLTGHYVEERKIAKQLLFCGGVMPFYEYQHIPGIDYLGKYFDLEFTKQHKCLRMLDANELSMKQVSSVAAQLGKKQVLSETGGMCGWDTTPRELKKLIEYQFVNGINLVCAHLFPVSEHGQRKRDYPLHFGPVVPWMKEHFREFADYIAELSKLLSESEEIVNTAILHPLRSTYFDYNMKLEKTGLGCSVIDNAFRTLIERIGGCNIPHHYLDETILARHGKVVGNTLVVGECTYSYLIIPKLYTMDKSTKDLLEEYVRNGGKLWLYSGCPTYLEGVEYDYDFLNSNITLKDISKAQMYKVNQSGIRTTLRKDKCGRYFLYALNLGDACDADFSLREASSFEKYDLETQMRRVLPTKVHFEKNESHILYLSDKSSENIEKKKEFHLDSHYSIVEPVNNFLVVDFVHYSTDGVRYSDELYHMELFAKLLQERYQGTVYLKYHFHIKTLVDYDTKLLIENNRLLKVCINGIELNHYDEDSEKQMRIYPIQDYIRQGDNELLVQVDFIQNKNVYRGLYDENVSETIKNNMCYDSVIEPVYIMGKFGVYGDFSNGKLANIITAKNLYIDKQAVSGSDFIKNGFPFFRGKIKLFYQQNLKGESVLALGESFDCVEIAVNGKEQRSLLLSDKIDLSEDVVEGNNEIVMTLYVGNRNMLGEMHSCAENPLLTGPDTYERIKLWNTPAIKLHFTETYHLVKTILDE